jgi:hypothetical protein
MATTRSPHRRIANGNKPTARRKPAATGERLAPEDLAEPLMNREPADHHGLSSDRVGPVPNATRATGPRGAAAPRGPAPRSARWRTRITRRQGCPASGQSAECAAPKPLDYEPAGGRRRARSRCGPSASIAVVSVPHPGLCPPANPSNRRSVSLALAPPVRPTPQPRAVPRLNGRFG